MCEWGQGVAVDVTIPADLSHTGDCRRKHAVIDRCIAPAVRALDHAGVVMRGSCCGHGDRPAVIVVDYYPDDFG